MESQELPKGWHAVDKYHIKHYSGATISKTFGRNHVTYTLWVNKVAIDFSTEIELLFIRFDEERREK